MQLSAVSEARRAEREFPAANDSLRDGDGEEDAGGADVVVVEEILDVGAEVVGVENPSAVRDGDAELMFFVALAVQGDEAKPLLLGVVDQRGAGDGFDRRGLVVVSVEGAEGPVQLRDGDGGAETRADGGSSLRGNRGDREVALGEARGAHSGGECEPGKRLELVVDEEGFEIRRGMFGIGDGRVAAAVVEDCAEELVVLS